MAGQKKAERRQTFCRRGGPSALVPTHVLTALRFERRALALAGRAPWFAFFNFFWFLDIEHLSRQELRLHC